MCAQISQQTLDELVEKLANIEHERWAHWQQYMHSKCERRPDGSMVVPTHLVQQWGRQIETSYSALTEAEKESDRDQVRRYLPIVLAALGIDVTLLEGTGKAES